MKPSGGRPDALASSSKTKSNTKKKTNYSNSPHRTLIAAFVVWKLFLFAIAAGSYAVGDAYDTSASLAVRNKYASGSSSSSQLNLLGRGLIARFASWDAVYFVSIARRGYRFEQEWAFGSALPLVIRGILRGLSNVGLLGGDEGRGGGGEVGDGSPEALVGVAVANGAHLLSALVLYRLGLQVWRGDRKLALVAALLHLVSPGGLFLSAPYAETACSLFTFLGYLLFARSCAREQEQAQAPLLRDVYVVLAGVSFGLATAFRSNALLNGIPFAWEALQHLPKLLSRRPSDTVWRLLALGVGGASVAAGSVIPQFVAYQRYCSLSEPSGVDPRPWCEARLPSIYTFVQQHYWNTGFLRYWNVPNIPLFLLAAPMLAVLAKSGIDQLLSTGHRPFVAEKSVESSRLLTLVNSAAAAQVLLAVLAVTTYHVQIITRIASGYPLWYWWLANQLIRGEKLGSRIVMFMIIYASIQGALFVSFLPPA
ncbi:glycosyltransferase family 76 protein [Podospora didyma]|uniref:GPI mannosyltransferase 2 n=1 Tax=Podospora didyma TaxID=330526 RepID=A0AAE0NHD3_9PEZI|nr:glycosyltransferase family 76 protein [Podospora didyma]